MGFYANNKIFMRILLQKNVDFHNMYAHRTPNTKKRPMTIFGLLIYGYDISSL